jgi:hypothetical protein
MPPDHISYRTGVYRPSGYIRRHDHDDEKSGNGHMTHDIGGSSPPSICPNCEIPILLGSDHRDGDGCFQSLKQFVKLCQDDIENSRMKDFQHPTREEMLDQLIYLEEQFNKFVVYTNTMLEEIRKIRRGTLVG